MHTYPLGRSQILAQYTGPFCERPGARLPLIRGSLMRKHSIFSFQRPLREIRVPLALGRGRFSAPSISIPALASGVNKVLSQCCQSAVTLTALLEKTSIFIDSGCRSFG